MSWWYLISQVGIDANGSWLKNRDIIVCNRVSAILSGLTLIMFFISLAFFGWNLPVELTLICSVIFLSPILFNRNGLVNASRMFLATSLSVATLIISLSDK